MSTQKTSSKAIQTFLGLTLIALLCYINIATSHVVNDVTGLNPIKVRTIIQPKTTQEIIDAIQKTSGPISIGGGRFSQGGQIAYENSLHLDMRQFDKVIDFNITSKQVTVQSGITWRKLQEFIDPHDLSVRIMQSYANFTVGGSLSVNVHGRYIGEGPIVHSILAIKAVLANGQTIHATPHENSELFYGIIGGYGGLGVITEVTLALTDNTKIERKAKSMPVSEYQTYFFKHIRDKQDIVFHNANIYPPNYDDVLDISWFKTNKALTESARLSPKNKSYFWAPKLVNFVASSNFAKLLRKNVLDPLYYYPTKVVWRNWEASYDLNMIYPKNTKQHRYGLREYFVPVLNFSVFLAEMKRIFQHHQVNVINVSIRHAHADPDTLLSWANGETFAFVVYYRQGTDDESKEKVKAWSRDMINAVLKSQGSYYLPYQILATERQFMAAYPKANDFFKLKQKVDPNYRFRNQLWKQHFPDISMKNDRTYAK